MAGSDNAARFEEFLIRARGYAQSPGLTSGLELDDEAVRLRQLAFTELKYPALGRTLEQVKRAVRYQDTDQMRELVGEIERLLEDRPV